MSFGLKSRKLLKLIPLLVAGLFFCVALFWGIRGGMWTQADFQALDLAFREAVKKGHGAALSPRIVYLTITDDSYDYFGKHILDRSDLAGVNDALARLGVEAVAYDMIFARPGHPDSDREFASSVDRVASVYLPIGLDYVDRARPFKWGVGAAYERFRKDYLRKPAEKGDADPFYATRSLMQLDEFAKVAFNAGHITAYCDPDGTYRHVIMLLKVEDLYFPTLALSMFLDYAGISLDDVIVKWGEGIVVPAAKAAFLEKDVVIPIDNRGRAFVPFARVWEKGFKKMEAHALLRYFQDENLRGNLTEFFEGKFVFVGDIAVGASDLGPTPLERDVPLMTLHGSLLNGLLENTFYTKWPFWKVTAVIGVAAVLLGVFAVPRSSWFLYGGGGIIAAAMVAFTWFQFIHFSLFPVAAAGGSFLFIFSGLIIGLEAAKAKEQAFVRNAFSRYVPEEVVKELLSNPESLQLGGEERIITVLFSDLADFTTISERMAPPALVGLLNGYLTEMTDLVLAEGGIIDKYQGDAIMAEFGAPLAMPDHAERAVRTGLRMQKRLKELRPQWMEAGLPEIRCRVGINTGPMVVGNIGSEQVFDYTVIGDSVNLASRLEGANKQYGTGLMISEFTHEHLPSGRFRMRALDVIKVKGKAKAVKVFEVYGEMSETMDPKQESYYRTYHEAFEAYMSRDFILAREGFVAACSLRPDDPVSANMITRIDALEPDRLPPDWDGSVQLTAK
jgi:adenylate cyclase